MPLTTLTVSLVLASQSRISFQSSDSAAISHRSRSEESVGADTDVQADDEESASERKSDDEEDKDEDGNVDEEGDDEEEEESDDDEQSKDSPNDNDELPGRDKDHSSSSSSTTSTEASGGFSDGSHGNQSTCIKLPAQIVGRRLPSPLVVALLAGNRNYPERRSPRTRVQDKEMGTYLCSRGSRVNIACRAGK
ncbi:hypothetical protein BDZ89DRAFT_1055466 [Hymenopellis radicata]|nr:hypothetical protein BDZ89DRAFT_1055466 [Hymenopellis radicata]